MKNIFAVILSLIFTVFMNIYAEDNMIFKQNTDFEKKAASYSIDADQSKEVHKDCELEKDLANMYIVLAVTACAILWSIDVYLHNKIVKQLFTHFLNVKQQPKDTIDIFNNIYTRDQNGF